MNQIRGKNYVGKLQIDDILENKTKILKWFAENENVNVKKKFVRTERPNNVLSGFIKYEPYFWTNNQSKDY